MPTTASATAIRLRNPSGFRAPPHAATPGRCAERGPASQSSLWKSRFRLAKRSRGGVIPNRPHYAVRMAVVIASALRKELGGDPLFDSVSFTVERRDRVALSGPNGAGKTTLLRILAGETELHGGELAFEKGARVALHDQRPPLERELTLREYVL